MKSLKKIIALVITGVMCSLISVPTLAAPENPNETVKVTDEIVLEMAENFGDAVEPEIDLEARNPMKFYDMDGQAIGYIVDFYSGENTYGYVVFDTTVDGTVSEYSIGEQSQNPYAAIMSSDRAPKTRNATEKLYKLDAFEYGIVNNSTGEIVNNYGELEQIEDIPNTSGRNKGKDPAEWDDVFFEIQEIYENYNLIATNHTDSFYALGEPWIEGQTGHYACAISALYACGAFYNALNYSDVAGDYMALWSATGTTQTSESGGIIYGGTTISDIGPGFVDFCSDRGITVRESTSYNPGYSFFTNAIDGGNIAVVHCGIISASTGERSGHSMTVEGYATLLKKSSGSSVQTLMVFDGWNEYVRYLNMGFDSWTDFAGTRFS